MDIIDSSHLSMELQTVSGEVVTVSKDSNQTTTKDLTILFTKVLASEKEYVAEDEEVEITTTLTNGSDIEVTAIGYKAVLNEAVEFVGGSVVVNDTPDAEADIIAGITLENMSPEAVTVVKYKIKKVAETEEEFATVVGTVNYTITDPIEGEKAIEENTNSLDLEVIVIDVEVVNSVNKSYTIKGDTLHYTTEITNGDKSSKSNIVFTNAIPEGTTFVEGSVKVDEVEQAEYNPQDGFALNDLDVGATAKVEFDVTVN